MSCAVCMVDVCSVAECTPCCVLSVPNRRNSPLFSSSLCKCSFLPLLFYSEDDSAKLCFCVIAHTLKHNDDTFRMNGIQFLVSISPSTLCFRIWIAILRPLYIVLWFIYIRQNYHSISFEAIQLESMCKARMAPPFFIIKSHIQTQHNEKPFRQMNIL